MRRYLAARTRDDRGLTLVEIMIAAALSALVFTIFAGVLVVVQGTLNREEERTQGNDQTRLALENLDRHLRSASMLWVWPGDPYTLLARTQSNTPTPGGAGQRCMHWKITDGDLLWRSWPDAVSPTPTGWTVVAEDIVNSDLPTPVDAFVLRGTGPHGGLTVDVTILVNQDLDRHPEATVGLETSITGRNVRAETGSLPSDPPDCFPLP